MSFGRWGGGRDGRKKIKKGEREMEDFVNRAKDNEDTSEVGE